ncbi:MAG: DUF3649 domain-containing protein [Halomonas sp.]
MFSFKPRRSASSRRAWVGITLPCACRPCP